MSRSWNRRIHIRLLASHAVLEHWQSWPRRLLQTEILETGSADLAVTVATINQHLDQLSWSGQLSLALSSRWLRFGVLPWHLQSGEEALDTLTAATLLAPATSHKESISAMPAIWTVRLDRATYGKDRLFAAIPTTSLIALNSLSNRSRPLQGWQPHAMHVWNQYRHHLEVSGGLLCLAEPGNLSLLFFQDGCVTDIRQRQFPPGNVESLVTLLHMQQMRQEHGLLLVTDDLPLSWQPHLAGFEKLSPEKNQRGSGNIQANRAIP